MILSVARPKRSGERTRLACWFRRLAETGLAGRGEPSPGRQSWKVPGSKVQDTSKVTARGGKLTPMGSSCRLQKAMTKFLFAVSVVFVTLLSVVRAEPSSAETQVADAIKAPSLSVVHLWAPWCSNCQAELKSGGWTKMVKENPQVHFFFVSVWNNGEDGKTMLATHEIAGQSNVTILADPGPRGKDHLKQFLGLPVSWIPTTWVFKGGDLRYALNYGEVRFPLLQQLLTDSNSEWSH